MVRCRAVVLTATYMDLNETGFPEHVVVFQLSKDSEVGLTSGPLSRIE